MAATSPWKRLCVLGLDPRNFEAQAERAAVLGATHVDLGKLPAKPRHEKTDPTDPYLEYSFILGCLFRFSTPEPVRAMTPTEYETLARSTLKERCAALRKHGLRARLWLLEPHTLPESVFEEHPDWRGPRVDFPPRAKRPYYAPCVDHPEVLALYREAVAALLKDCPEIETFRLTTNDSATGICWSHFLYPGPNGPAACKARNYGERIHDFLQAWLDGATDAGVDARVLLSPRGMSTEQAAFARSIEPERGVVLPTPGGVPNSSAGAGGPTPTIGIWNPVPFLNGLSKSLGVEEALVSCGCELHWRLLERFVGQPARTTVERAQMLLAQASEMVGEANAEKLVGAWETMAAGLGRIESLPWRGLLFEHGLLSKRWITRPFVAFQEELTAEETDYWRPYLFEAGGEGEVEDMTNIHAVKVVDSIAQATFLRLNCQAAIGQLDGAASALEGLASAAHDDSVSAQAMRLRALACLFRTIIHATTFQVCMDRARKQDMAGQEWPLYWTDGQPTRVFITEILRNEIDNVRTLADLLDAAPEPLLHTAQCAEDEDCFTLPPDVTDKLRLKAAIMARKIRDIERLFPFANK